MSETMATAPHQALPGTAPLRHKLSVDDLHRMAAAGILAEDARVELIEGELFDMAPIGSRHAGMVARLTKTLAAVPATSLFVQSPLGLPSRSEPLPDLMLRRERPDDYCDALPNPVDVILIIEVADSYLAYDRDRKIPLYAQHGIPEAWLVDLVRRCVTVYRQPRNDSYAITNDVATGTLTSAGIGGVSIDVDALFA